MAKLIPVLDSLDDLPDGLRDYYAPGTGALDGKYVAQVEPTGGYALENISGLQSAAKKEREARQEIEKKFKAYDGLDPDEARQAMAKLAEIGDNHEEQVNAAAEALARKREKALEQKFKQQYAPVEQERETFKREAETFKSQLSQTLTQDRLAAAVAKAGGDDILAAALAPRVRTVINDDGQMEVRCFNENGDELFDNTSDGGTVPRSVDSFVEKLKLEPRYERYFAADSPSPSPSGRNGTSRPGSPPAAGRNIRVHYDEIKKDPKAYAAAQERARKLGGTVEVQGAPWSR